MSGCNTCNKEEGPGVNLLRRPTFQVDPNFLEALLGEEEAKGAYGPSPPQGLDQAIAYPFTRLENGTFLHDRSEKDVYRILIDSYRFRTDEYCGGGGIKPPEGTVYAKRPDSLPAFRRYLELAATRNGLLPPWWTPEKQKECEDFGMTKGEFQDLHKALEQFGATYHYADSRFPQQLRMLAEAIYGTGLDGKDIDEGKGEGDGDTPAEEIELSVLTSPSATSSTGEITVGYPEIWQDS
ncbi:hypothetical protein CEP54_010219 [Fusarium duplospermum]|uniref:Uncharacterized protein n=1 Tax=Fusarium duplospermum TaxID=1325734 RepID=A0A428PL92_9HYPO|nr:hypothetical protein CEP54_010219 [Fusarium duplospermum]